MRGWMKASGSAGLACTALSMSIFLLMPMRPISPEVEAERAGREITVSVMFLVSVGKLPVISPSSRESSLRRMVAHGLYK